MDIESNILLWLIGSAFAGGLTVKILDIAYLESLRRFDRRSNARSLVDEHLYPLLKSADELFGKLRSIANDDFSTLRANHTTARTYNDYLSFVYVLVQVWANLEIYRLRGLSVSVSRDRRGRKLNAFVRCLESRKIRLIDRSTQRAISELILVEKDGRFSTVPYIEFVRRFECNLDAKRWMAPLLAILERTEHASNRQRLLVYGTIIHVLIDTLDPRHHVSSPREPYHRLLSKKSWRDLKYRVFKHYLSFVRKPQKYLGPPKRRP